MDYLPQPGATVRLMRYNGVVQHVYTREDGEDAWLEITFVNNLFKQQPHELHLWSKVKDLLQVSDATALQAELEMSREAVERRFSQLTEPVNGNRMGELHEQPAQT